MPFNCRWCMRKGFLPSFASCIDSSFPLLFLWNFFEDSWGNQSFRKAIDLLSHDIEMWSVSSHFERFSCRTRFQESSSRSRCVQGFTIDFIDFLSLEASNARCASHVETFCKTVERKKKSNEAFWACIRLCKCKSNIKETRRNSSCYCKLLQSDDFQIFRAQLLKNP